MEIRAIKIQLLNHLFYHTEVSNGSITGGFIGDLALNYALRNAVSLNETLYESRLKPEYEEIKDFGFYITVARPVKEFADEKNKGKQNLISELKPKRTGSYTRNTLFNTDGFTDVQSIEKSGKSPFKNLIRTQGVALKNGKSDNYFLALLLSEKKFEIPPTLRVGNQRETLLKLEEINFSQIDTDFWLNAFTLKIVFNNLEKAMNIAVENENVNYHYIIENYTLLKGFSKEQVSEVFNSIYK
jgi:CRISPR-associated protein Csc1